MILDAELAGDEWTTPYLDWRYFSYATSPTIAAHDGEVTNNREDGEYRRSTHSTSRTLCQATKRGTLVDFLDAFEVERKKTCLPP